MRYQELNAEDAHRAARRLEQAAQAATFAADRLEESVRQFRMLTEDGYGNNVSRLVQALEKQQTP